MNCLALMVPEEFVARVDRALKREGLDVSPYANWHEVVPGRAPADVPRVLAYDGPVLA